MKKGKFITIDGVEGAGKSTQIAFICDYLHRKGIDVVKTREPGGTDLGEKIRSLLLGLDNEGMHSDTELLLMFSARNELIQNKINLSTFTSTFDSIYGDKFSLFHNPNFRLDII